MLIPQGSHSCNNIWPHIIKIKYIGTFWFWNNILIWNILTESFDPSCTTSQHHTVFTIKRHYKVKQSALSLRNLKSISNGRKPTPSKHLLDTSIYPMKSSTQMTLETSLRVHTTLLRDNRGSKPATWDEFPQRFPHLSRGRSRAHTARHTHPA